MHMCIIVAQEITDEPMHRDIESMMEEVDENYNLAGVDISYAQVDNSTNAQNIIIEFHPGVFQGILFIQREAMVKDGDS